MSQEVWGAVDDYIADHLTEDDEILDAVLDASEKAGLPAGAIAPNEGKLLNLLAHIVGARRILEIGTLGGYSAIWLARALPADGRLITLEADARYAKIARANIEMAGLTRIVELRVGPALQALQELASNGAAPFDVIFIDADKQNHGAYLEWSLKLSRTGTVIVADNVVRGGAILDPDGGDPRLGEGGIQGIRQFYDLLAREPRLSGTAIQTVSGKGHDGLALALVVDKA
ncbi:MAG: O-methyltransferase [Solirubrobacterales bacterium]|nr:O-methyltransferase [Solirubrobacterales bacterium]